jgi:hypothetical protein
MSAIGNLCDVRSQFNMLPSLSNSYLRGASRVNLSENIHTMRYSVVQRSRCSLLLPHSSQINAHVFSVGEATTPLEEQIASLSSAQRILDLLQRTPLTELMASAASLRNQGHPSIITFSPKVFIPLTRLCRDSCGYCTFAQGPVPGHRVYMTIEEVLTVARMGAEQGCTEALFTLGTNY